MVGKVFKYFVIIFCISFFVGADAFAKRKKTVSDVLRKIEKVKIKKKRSLLPGSSKYLAPKSKVNLRSVKPPSSNRFYYDEGTSEQELEKITDEQINHLFGMTQKFSKSRRRGELWVRLAELYVDKAKLIELRLQTDYDNKLRDYSEGKTKVRPRLNLKPAEEYNKKSITLYEYFVRDFPKDPKMDQALFFLGYNYFEIGKTDSGRKKYTELTKRFPKSPYVDESNFALGEYYFEREKWKPAKKHYDKISRNKRSRLYSFALYKTAWCKYKTGRTKSGLKDLERVIYEGRKAKGGASGGKVSQIRLASEAAKDIVVFYPEVYKAKNARSYFNRVLGEKSTDKMLGKLAFYYVDKGNKSSAKYIFKQLIAADPFSVKAYEYQHEIVKMYQAAGNQKVFKKELFAWIEDYGPGSLWRKENKGKKTLIADSDKLIESTLRNYILQLHQTAQNSRAKYSQKLAKDGYEMYFSSIKDKTHSDQMNFFNGELLFDMKDYVGAAKSYNRVVARGDKKGKYYSQSLLNSVLSLEKKIPSAAEVKTIVGDSKEAVPFTSNLKSFEKSTLRYLSENKKDKDTVAIRYRLGSLYYYFKQYKKAQPMLMEIVEDSPKDKHAEYSANIILDMYNQRKDFKGLVSVSDKLLAVPGLKNTNLASRISNIKSESQYELAAKSADGKDPLKAAEAYMEYIKKNPNGKKIIVSKFNAAVSYEKAGRMTTAISLYNDVMNARVKTSQDKDLKKKARKFLAFLYERTGQYAKAAGAFEGFAKKYPKDPDSTSYHFNAAVIYNALDFHTSSIRNYTIYQKRSNKTDGNAVNYAIAKMWDRRKRFPSKAIAYYDKFLRGPIPNKINNVEAAYKVAKIHEKLRRKSLTEKWYKKVIYRQKKYGVGASYAAEAKFKLIEKNDFKAFKSVRIPANAAKMAGAVQKKLGLLNKLKEKLKSVVSYDDAYQIVAALTLQGEASNHMADSIYKAPIPKSLKGEQLKQYKAGVDNLAKPFKEQAIEALNAAIKKAYELQVYDANVLKAINQLDKIKPQPMVNEMKVLKSLWLSRAGI